MKKIFKLTAVLFTLTALLGCELDLVNQDVTSSDKVYASFSISGTSARTALPSEINWASYTYTLDGIEGYGTSSAKASKTIFSNKTYASLSELVELEAANYQFTLTAYASSVAVLQGQAVADFSTGNKTVSFKMYPLTGASGNAEITITLPDDGVITSITAGYSTNPVAGVEDLTLKQSLSITSAASSRSALYSITDLDSGSSQYAVFYFYDAAGGLIASRSESLYIVGGLTSYSTIDFTENDYFRYGVTVNLKVDGVLWPESEKTLKLVSSSNPSVYYTMTEDKNSSGVFTASVATRNESEYAVYEGSKDTGVTLLVNASTAEVNYYSVELNAGKGTEISPLNGQMISETSYVILSGESFNFSTSLLPGYKKGSSFAVKAGSLTLTESDGSYSATVTSTTEITSSGAEAIVYTITYSDTSYFISNPATKPTTYTVEEDVDLPTATDYRKTGYVLDGWKTSSDATSGIAYIAAGSYYENLTLYPIWKESVYVDTVNKIIYANGISLLIKEGSNSKTLVYTDFDADGNVDSSDGDELIYAQDGSTYDFSGYALKAANYQGKEIASDFTFRMTGGRIASIEGLGADKSNRSYLYISGTAVIGSYDYDSSSGYSNVKGIDLSTIYNRRVVVDGQMSGDYKVILLTEYNYDRDGTKIVAYIDNPSYASFNKFMCFEDTPENGLYKNSKISMKNIEENGSSKTVIHLANPSPIAMPSQNEIIIEDGSFTLGDSVVSISCSVFSISVTNGTFSLGTTTLNGASGLSVLAQTSATSYSTSLATNTPYIYMHILSSNDSITADAANEFISQIEFTPDEGKEINISINLETVPYTMIESMGTKFSYFNGSFYMGVSKSSAINWEAAYDEAKGTNFNGLQGYLINITSQVENNYIYSQMGLGNAWTGGARFSSAEDSLGLDSTSSSSSYYTGNNYVYTMNYDADTAYMSDRNGPTKRTYEPNFRWMAGPEAGQIFTTVTINAGKAGYGVVNRIPNCTVEELIGYTNWNSGEPNDSLNQNGTYYSEQCVHFLTNGEWNDYSYQYQDVKGYIVEFTPYQTQYGSQVASYQAISNSASYTAE